MKKLIVIVTVIIGLFLIPATASADSPITSTNFSEIYQDIAIVKEAGEYGIINSEIAAFLADSDNPIDVKAAVINALSWDVDGKSNAEKYSQIIYHQSVKELHTESLSGDQQFCIGYLLAMDDYFHTTSAFEYLQLSEVNLPNSFTVALIRALVESMDMTNLEWEEHIKPILSDNHLVRDMRQGAVNIILDYIALYSRSDQIEVSQNNFLIENGRSQIVYLYGTLPFSETPYQLTKSSDIAATAIRRDKYGVYYIIVTGVENGPSMIQISNSDNSKKTTISFDVVSKDAYQKLKQSLAMYIGSRKTYVGTTKVTLTQSKVPFLLNAKPYVPIDFIGKVIGGTVEYDNMNKSLSLVYRNQTMIFKAGSNAVGINGAVTNLKTKIMDKMDILYISAEDFANLTDQQFLYENGLIMIMNKNVKISITNDDYILEEITERVKLSNFITSEPKAYLEKGKYGYKDSLGNVVIKPKFHQAGEFIDGVAAVSIINSKGVENYGFINASGKYVIKPEFNWASSFSNGLATVFKGNHVYFIDRTGKVKISSDFGGAGCFHSGLAPVLNRNRTKWGYIDRKGKLVIPYRYSECTPFQEGYAAVLIDGKWGYIDRTGKLVIQPTFEQAWDFYHGLATVQLNGESYLINSSGKTIVYYENGDSYVGDQKDGFIHGKGVYTWTDGSQYSGNVLKGTFTGKGVFTTPDGGVEDGNWNDGNYLGE